jgi:hypothetical protein
MLVARTRPKGTREAAVRGSTAATLERPIPLLTVDAVVHCGADNARGLGPLARIAILHFPPRWRLLSPISFDE